MTRGAQIGEILSWGGIATKDVWFGGSTGHATFYCHDSATKAGRLLLAAGFRVRGPIESIDYAKHNKGGNLCPSTLRVWRLGMYL